MCWSEAVSVAMVGVGAVATVVVAARGQPRAIWLTLGYFTAMEALQAAGYSVVDQCGAPSNRAITLLSFLHIVFQPLFLNAFAMELVPGPVKARLRRGVYLLLCGLLGGDVGLSSTPSSGPAAAVLGRRFAVPNSA